MDQSSHSIRAHIQILKSRVEILECELKNSSRQIESTESDLRHMQTRWNTTSDDLKERKDELIGRYNQEVDDYNRQIQLSEEVLAKKRDERQALLGYLKEKNICDSTGLDLRNFDWDTLRKIIQGRDKSEIIIEQEQQARKLSDLNLKARENLNDLSELVSSALLIKEDRNRTFDYVKGFVEDWKRFNEEQEKKIAKLQTENERLNLLIRQCAASNEPMSEYVTKNVRAKCHSFLNSDNPQELMTGLTRFKMRQERMIKLLKHKENKLTREINQLQVAKDQTHDQMLYYSNIITINRDLNMSVNLAGNDAYEDEDTEVDECIQLD